MSGTLKDWNTMGTAMTPDVVKRRVAAIAALAGDDERAHGMEDELHRDALTAIALGNEHAAEIAALALETAHIEFSRWCS